MGHRGEEREARWSLAARSVAGDEVAHVRARFGMDPATPSGLADAWSQPTGAIEEDEAEFIDAVADCVSVGLPVEAAVASWREGRLEVEAGVERAIEPEDDDETAVFGGAFDDEPTDVYKPGQGRRVLVR